MKRARLQRSQSFNSMNEINILSFDNLISLPISPENLQTDRYFCSDSSSKIKKGGPLKKRKATVVSNEEAEKEKKMKADDSPEKLKKDGAVAEAEAPPPLKRDFIHVRARRGQATDSHSLAERVSFFSVLRGRNPSITVRRERISERMKYLEGLVPGCNKITGKAGMLDEIINYVQSLQRQVEFLSMKLATVNPWIDSNIDGFFPKEVNLGCNPSMTTVNVSPELVEPNCIQINPMPQMSANCGLDIDMNFSDLPIRLSLGSPLTVHGTFLDPSFNVNNSTWEANSQSIADLEFIQLPIQSLSGSYSPYHLKL